MNGKRKPIEKITRKIMTFLLIGLILVNINSVYSDEIPVIREESVPFGPGLEFNTPLIFINGQVFLNFTNLPTSTTNIRIRLYLGSNEEVAYSPDLPELFDLVPGESLADTYTLVDSTLKSGGAVIYGCWIYNKSASATVRFESLVIEKGEEAPGFLVFSSLFAITMITVFLKIKSVKKRERKKSFEL